MLAGEGIARLRVIERLTVEARSLPIRGFVALRAVWPEAALVLVFVARSTRRRQAHPRVIQIFARQKSALRRSNMLRQMAGTTAHSHVFAIEDIAGLCVIESRRRRVPMDHVEAHAVVIRVALHASRSRRTRTWKRRVQSLVLLDLRSNLAMALQALERRCPRGNLVALDAVRVSTEALVGPGQRAGRDLCRRPRALQCRGQQQQTRAKSGEAQSRAA